MLYIYYVRKSSPLLLVLQKNIVMHMTYKTHGLTETFLAALFNLNRTAIDSDNSNKKEIYLDDMILDSDDDTDNIDDEATETHSSRTTTKSISTYPIYQMMMYTVTDGKTKTPLHVMTGQSVYSRCRSRSTITSLDKINLSISYDDVQRSRALLVSYAMKKS